jgi:hypothetical protein
MLELRLVPELFAQTSDIGFKACYSLETPNLLLAIKKNIFQSQTCRSCTTDDWAKVGDFHRKYCMQKEIYKCKKFHKI